ncbi:hypothetical protein CB1_000146011 [Camelus ferus]|nr:hypothetical protein CB1_000146011 [Camelus ferus]
MSLRCCAHKATNTDLLVQIRRSQGKVWLIDFNPFGEVTDSLLFTWDELISGRNLKGDFTEGEALEQDSPAFRCTNSEVTVQPSPYLSYRLPKDFVDLSTGEDAHKLIDFLKLRVRTGEVPRPGPEAPPPEDTALPLLIFMSRASLVLPNDALSVSLCVCVCVFPGLSPSFQAIATTTSPQLLTDFEEKVAERFGSYQVKILPLNIAIIDVYSPENCEEEICFFSELSS